MPKKKIYDFDIETNGLLETVDTVWCICAIDQDDVIHLFHERPDLDGKRVEVDGEVRFIPNREGNLEDGVRFLMTADVLRCHNLLGYDVHILERFFDFWEFDTTYPNMVDTLLQSQVQWFDRKPVKGYRGNHGLAPWGARFGINKPEIQDWSFMDEYKLDRCWQDILIQKKTSEYLNEEAKRIKERCNGLDFTESLIVEHEYRYNCTKSEIRGANVDKPHMESCVVELDGMLEEIRNRVEPQLPMYPKYPVKTTAADVKTRLGFKKIPPVKYVMKEVKGVLKKVPVKKYYTPTTKVFKQKVVKDYYATCSETFEETPHFDKLKDLREYIKSIGKEFKDFDLTKSERNVKLLNANTCSHFELEETETGMFWGPFSKVSWHKTTMTQDDKIKNYLLKYCGWTPTTYNMKKDNEGKIMRDDKGQPIPTSPKLTEDSFDSIEGGLGEDIILFGTLYHRRNFIKNFKDPKKGLINLIRPDGRLTCGINTYGTVSSRSSHSNWVNPPSNSAVYGKPIRKIIIADEGESWQLGTVDIPAAHPRVLADLSKDPDFIESVTSGAELDKESKYLGTDFHTRNAVILGLIDEDERLLAVVSQDPKLIEKFGKPRKLAKGSYYCIVYGGSGKKLASILGVPDSVGCEKRQQYLEGLGLDEVLKELESKWDLQKWGKGSFVSVKGGYHILADSKHKLINYLALGSEAVMNKRAVNWIEKELKRRKMKTYRILSMHDENLFSIYLPELEEFRPLAEKMYTVAAREMGLTISFDSQLEIGPHYGATH